MTVEFIDDQTFIYSLDLILRIVKMIDTIASVDPFIVAVIGNEGRPCTPESFIACRFVFFKFAVEIFGIGYRIDGDPSDRHIHPR